MGTLRQLLRFNGTMWSLGVSLLLVGLLAGCTTPLINVQVQVDTCQTGGGKQFGPLSPPGMCNPVQVTSATPIPSGTVCKDSSGNPMTCPTGAQCTGGYMCMSGSPGTCSTTRSACKTYWTQISGTSGTCSCAC
jgi:hypothetical protein